MKLKLQTENIHVLEIQSTTQDIKYLATAMGCFSLFDFRKVNMTPEQQKAFTEFYNDITAIAKVL